MMSLTVVTVSLVVYLGVFGYEQLMILPNHTGHHHSHPPSTYQKLWMLGQISQLMESAKLVKDQDRLMQSEISRDCKAVMINCMLCFFNYQRLELHRCSPTILKKCGCQHLHYGQLGQTCNESRPCDIQKDLMCYQGHCIGNSTNRHCFAEGIWYENGRGYVLDDCKRQCFCQDGHFNCTATCKHEKWPPLGCRNARLIYVHGRCCKEWVCE